MMLWVPLLERRMKKLELDGKIAEERMIEERKIVAAEERTMAVEGHKKARQRKLVLGHTTEQEPVRR